MKPFLHRRTIPPAAAPIYPSSLITGLWGIAEGQAVLERFRWELKQYFGVDHCFLFSSGKAALTVLLTALHERHPHRNEVLIPAFTCYSVPAAIKKAGLKVRLCDLDVSGYDYDFDAMSNWQGRTSKLLAVISIHLFGIPSDVNRLRQCIQDPDVFIVEDAAQAMGTEYKGKKLGTLADAGIFSLGRGKVLSTVEGGILVTNQAAIATAVAGITKGLGTYSLQETFKLLMSAIVLMVFMNPWLFWIPKSLPFLRLGQTIYDPDFPVKKMTPFQAGLAKNWHKTLKDFQIKRRGNARQWINAASRASNGSVQWTDVQTISQYPLIRFPVRIKNGEKRRQLLAASEASGAGIMPAYPDAITGILELSEEFQGDAFQEAEACAKQLITLPVHPFVRRKDIDHITKTLMPG